MEGGVFAENLVNGGVPPAHSHAVNGVYLNGEKKLSTPWRGPPRKPWENVVFDPKLKPKSYQIAGTPKESVVLILDVEIFDSSGKLPYRGDVLIEGERITQVGTVSNVNAIIANPKAKIVKGQGRTLMSGLGDAHTHLSWNSGDIPALGGLGVEEHILLTARSARTAIDSGYTMCFGAASAQNRLDVVIRDTINDGKVPGPRYLANGKEIVRPQDAVGQNGLATVAEGPEEMSAAVNRHIDFGVDQVKLTMSGEEICEPESSEKCYYTDEETAACVRVAHGRGKRLCAHARARDSVKMCVKHGIDVIFHASWTDEEGMDMLEKNKEKLMVVPAINWLYATLYESESYGYAMSEAERDGYVREFAMAKKALREMHERGITVLPGGDYGFAWTPHGTYARDLDHFVQWLGFTPMESLLAATVGVAKLFMREDELGQIKPGYFADCILVDGNPLEDITILQDHSKLTMIMINGRIHKASQKDFLTRAERKVWQTIGPTPSIPRLNGDHQAVKLTNYVAYRGANGDTRIGHLDLDSQLIRPLRMPSGAALSSLYEVIELKQAPIAIEEALPLASVTVLPPINGRDVLAVGKNYVDHAKEFHASGYDSSDKIAMPSHPVIFTKRHTSIIAAGDDVVLNPRFTETLDYEGEVGVIIGKSGSNINEQNAMDYVWGYTIINDVTAREKQRDHKQFYIGKSGDTYCPMGPIAVPAKDLPSRLKVETFVNGELRQEATTDDLIFSVAKLIATISTGATIQAGDVIATGTPAGVGFGQVPPKYLKSGDVVEIKVTGLGTLRNTVVDASESESADLGPTSVLPTFNTARTPGRSGLTDVGSKLIHLQISGKGSKKIVFVHGLGGTAEFYGPLLQTARLEESYQCYRYDLEGHGLSPTSAASVISIQSYVDDLKSIFQTSGIQSAILVAHSMGGLIAMSFAAQNPELVEKMILLGPARYPIPAAALDAQNKRVAAVRAGGMSSIVEAVAANGTSTKTQAENPIAVSAVKATLMSQDPEGYAKACTALANAAELRIDLANLSMPVLIVTGSDDKASPVAVCEGLRDRLSDARLEVIEGVGHWSVFEDPVGVGRCVQSCL